MTYAVSFERRDGVLYVRRPDGYGLASIIPTPVFRHVPSIHEKHAAAARGWVPNAKRITMALDSCGLDGPEVDEALGVAEPTVDWWENGSVVPSKDDVARLATLTGFPLHFFYRGDPPELERAWFCGEDGCRVIGGGTDDAVESASQCPTCHGSGMRPPPAPVPH